MIIPNIIDRSLVGIIPAKNEAGNLRNTVSELISLNIFDEIILVEGGSEDSTWSVAKSLELEYPNCIAVRQPNKGKFDAVVKGINSSKSAWIVIWDADATVKKDDNKEILSIALNQQVPATGNRLSGLRHQGSMRKANLVGNYLFALLWMPFLQWKVVDMLCGTKVILRHDFEKIPKWVLASDPFGDFVLIASGIVSGRSLASIPVEYLPRKYGESNIKRWRSGIRLVLTSLVCFMWILLEKFRLLNFAGK